MKRLIIAYPLAIFLSIIGSKAFAHDIAVENADGVTIYYAYINDGKELSVTSSPDLYSRYSNNVVIPEDVIYNNITRKVTRINDYAFYGCGDLSSVTSPPSITYIGYSSFLECNNLKEIRISDLAAWCKINFHDYPLNYSHHLFLNNTEIHDLVIPNSVTSISRSAFYGCSSLKSVIIPNSVTEIEESVFRSCDSLTSVTIPNSINSIKASTFWDCINLSSITIPNSVTTIGNSAFSGCSRLTSIIIPNSIVNIGKNAFLGCGDSAVSAVFISDLEAWCNICFSNRWANPLSGAHHLFLNDTEIKDLVIPNSITNIENNTFSGCRGLTSITIPQNVVGIGECAFYGCI